MAAREIAPHLAENAVVVVKSTVPVGTGDDVEEIIASERRRGGISVASNPAFLREGAAIGDFLKPDRVILGVEDERARAVLTALYGGPLAAQNTPIVVARRHSAELIRHAANAARLALGVEASDAAGFQASAVARPPAGLPASHRAEGF
jgi:UDPglucose 6-dehydrogenase